MRRASNVLSGQAYGKVDWISQDKREVGMYIQASSGRTTRCVVIGSEVEGLLANNVLTKGMMITSYGEVYGRYFHRKQTDTYEGEVVCVASRIIPEKPSHEGRVRGSVVCSLKGVIMNWSQGIAQVKTFFNSNGKDQRPTQFTCSLYLKTWIGSMPEQARANFIASLRNGREYTATCLTEASAYQNKQGETTPCLQMLPVDFRLQG